MDSDSNDVEDAGGPSSSTTSGDEPEEEADISVFTYAALYSKEAFVAGVA